MLDVDAIGALAPKRWNDAALVLDEAAPSWPHSRKVRTVAVFYYRMGTGGAERVTRDLMTLWIALGYHVVFFCDEPDEGEPSDSVEYRLPEGVELETLPSCLSSQGDTYGARAHALHRALEAHNVDSLVYCQWLAPTLPWDLLVARELGISFIVHTHGTFLVLGCYGIPDLLELPSCYRHANGVVCLSRADYEFWSSYCSRVYETANPSPREMLGNPPASLCGHRILWVGRVSDDKYPTEVVPVMRKVVEAIPDATLSMVGPVDARLGEILASQIAEAGLSGHIVLEGGKTEDEMPAVYQGADIFLSTSHLEGWSLALAEAMASGLPVAMYDLSYLTLLKGERGIRSSSVGDTAALARAVIEILSDDVLRRDLGTDARAYLEELDGFDAAGLWARVFAECSPQLRETAEEESSCALLAAWDAVSFGARELVVENRSLRVQFDACQERVCALEQENDAIRQNLLRVTGSVSFRVGRVLTAPARKLRDAMRGE